MTDESGSRWTGHQAELERVLETSPVGITVLDRHGEIVRANGRAETLLGLERSAIEGRAYDDEDWEIWDEAGRPISAAAHPVARVLATGETVTGFTHGITLSDGSERWLSSNIAPLSSDDEPVEGVVVAIEDVTELKRLNELIETIEPVAALLPEAASRGALEAEVCAVLADRRLYDRVWIGRSVAGRSRIEQVAAAGAPGSGGTDQPASIPPESHLPCAAAALDTGEIRLLGSDGADQEQEAGDDRPRERSQNVAFVPLTHADRRFGVLGLETRRAECFADRERGLLRTLGKRIGQVIDALETEALLRGEDLIELTVRSSDPRSVLVAVSETLGCRFEVLETIPVGETDLLFYLEVAGAAPAAVEDAFADRGPDVAVRPIRSWKDPVGGVLEVQTTGQTIAEALIDRGAVVTADVVSEGRAEVTCEVPATQDIASLLTSLEAEFSGIELVEKHKQPPGTAASGPAADTILDDAVVGALTERQRQVLQAAVHGGFFESPRRSTATEIAEALSLTQTTVSYHLREAQRTVFAALLDRDWSPSRPGQSRR